MRLLLMLMIGLTVQSCSSPDWEVEELADPMSDQISKTAVVSNKLGHTFSIYRIPRGSVWGNLTLSEEASDEIDWQKPPIYRIDKHEPKTTSLWNGISDAVKFFGYGGAPSGFNFLVWHGDADEGLAPDLIRMMEGQEIIFGYFLATGGYSDTSFSLSGAASAISAAIGIPPEIDHLAQRKLQEFQEASAAAMKQCGNDMRNFQACMRRISECRKKANQDSSILNSCLQ